jgi:hypothetical protein
MEPREKIRIDAGELYAPEVEESLARQQSFGMAAAVQKAPERKASLLYRSWFVLMVAGTLGGLAGWAAYEPFIDDGIAFEGRVDQFLQAPPGGALMLNVSGIEIGIPPHGVRILEDGKAVERDRIREGAHVRMVGVMPEHSASRVLWAYRVELLPGDPPAGTLSLQTLAIRDMFIGLLLFPVIAAFVGLFVAAADGLLSRAWRRAIVCALVGMACGLALGLVTSVVGTIVYNLGWKIVQAVDERGMESTAGFLAQMISRGVAWAIVGMAMGLGQGIALRSKRMVVNGLLGGLVGGLLGGLLFDPIAALLERHSDELMVGGDLSRAVGFAVIGLTTGLMIGVVELLARDAWLKMLVGPLAGKEFVLFKNPTVIGSSPKADIYLFKDPEVEPTHALLHTVGDGYEVEDRTGAGRVFHNGRPVRRARLENGDQLRIGRTVLSFGVKES